MIDCIFYHGQSVLASLLADRGEAELHRQLHPVIEGLPPAPGCRENWMWHLADFEAGVYAKVSVRAREGGRE